MRPTIQSFAILAVFSASLLSSACSENPVGRKCFIGVVPDGGVNQNQAIIASPALECPSRTCLRQPLERELPPSSEFADLCTAECSTDDDCDRVPESPCQEGFTCITPTATGPFCCRKLCVCKDYIVIPEEGGVAELTECDPNIETNTCINLPGREPG